MELFIDIDGVILDFESAFVRYIRINYLPELPIDYLPKSWAMEDEFGQVDITEAWNLFIRTEEFQTLDLLVDQSSFNGLSQKYPLYLITNLPSGFVDQRRQNLELHRLKYRDLKIGGHFDFGETGYPLKSSVIESIRDSQKKLVFLDDHPENCSDVKRIFPESWVFLMTRPHNKNLKDDSWTRVDNWSDFLACVSDLERVTV